MSGTLDLTVRINHPPLRHPQIGLNWSPQIKFISPRHTVLATSTQYFLRLHEQLSIFFHRPNPQLELLPSTLWWQIVAR